MSSKDETPEFFGESLFPTKKVEFHPHRKKHNPKTKPKRKKNAHAQKKEQRKLENTPTGHRLCVVAMTTLPSDMSDPTVGWKRLRPAHDLGEADFGENLQQGSFPSTKSNIEPENNGVQQESPCPRVDFQGIIYVSFRGSLKQNKANTFWCGSQLMQLLPWGF